MAPHFQSYCHLKQWSYKDSLHSYGFHCLNAVNNISTLCQSFLGVDDQFCYYHDAINNMYSKKNLDILFTITFVPYLLKRN